MKTWKTRDGKWVSEKPKEYMIGVDKHGEEVFINDILIYKDSYNNYKWKVFKANEINIWSWSWYLRNSYLKKY